MKYAVLLIVLTFSGQNILAADKTETFDFTAPQNDEVQPPRPYSEPAFAELSKVDALAVQVDTLTQKVEALERKLETCGCKK